MSEDRALLYARTLAQLREAAWALLNHDTAENRARLYQLVVPEEWAAECAQFGCHEQETDEP
jgi:hypothetical protein